VPSAFLLRRAGLALVVGVTSLVVVAPASGGAKGLTFTKPLKLTVDPEAGGYEPGVVVDRFGNVYVTAHKANHTLLVSPDQRSATRIRSMSWLWTSPDGGRTFNDLPGRTPLMEQNAEFGDEGDLATDPDGHVYFVDTNVTDISFSRWKASGLGQVALESSRPAVLAEQPVDDRPWVAANGDGTVLYAGNEGDSTTYTLGQQPESAGSGSGPGRYTVYMSHDRGETFDRRGVTLRDSGWCRPAADKRARSKVFFLACTSSDPAVRSMLAFVSRDDGRTWQRYVMGTYSKVGLQNWPSAAVAPDGTFYAMFNEKDNDVGDSLMLYSSSDQGRHWKKRNVLPFHDGGSVGYNWFDVSRSGQLGFAYGYSSDGQHGLYASTLRQRGRAQTSLVSPSTIPGADFFQVAFGPDERLHVAWDQAAGGTLSHDVFYSHSQ
jgi:DNA-binding beta-propeller fold protein YncE